MAALSLMTLLQPSFRGRLRLFFAVIVVVPMIVRRNDEKRRERSVAGFGRAMRALGKRAPAIDASTEVFVPRERRAATVAAAALTFALVIWWVVRRGRGTDLLESRP